MNKTLSVMLAAGLLVSGVAGAAEKPAVAFTPEQEARFLEETERETVKLYKIFDQSPEEARRKGDGTWVSYYQRFLKRGHRMQLAWRRLKNRLRR